MAHNTVKAKHLYSTILLNAMPLLFYTITKHVARKLQRFVSKRVIYHKQQYSTSTHMKYKLHHKQRHRNSYCVHQKRLFHCAFYGRFRFLRPWRYSLLIGAEIGPVFPSDFFPQCHSFYFFAFYSIVVFWLHNAFCDNQMHWSIVSVSMCAMNSFASCNIARCTSNSHKTHKGRFYMGKKTLE